LGLLRALFVHAFPMSFCVPSSCGLVPLSSVNGSPEQVNKIEEALAPFFLPLPFWGFFVELSLQKFFFLSAFDPRPLTDLRYPSCLVVWFFFLMPPWDLAARVLTHPNHFLCLLRPHFLDLFTLSALCFQRKDVVKSGTKIQNALITVSSRSSAAYAIIVLLLRLSF